MRSFVACLAAAALTPFLGAGEIEVTGIQAVCRHGQTFVTWKDVAEGEAGVEYRYSLYRSAQPITAANLDRAELCYHGVLNNSARLFGHGFNMKDRLDPAKPTAVLVEGGKSLPQWTGVGIHTVRKNGRAFYAVVATDEKHKPLTKVVPGRSATSEPIEETVAPIQPIKLYDSKGRPGPYIAQTAISGQKGLPMNVSLHASQGQGGTAGEYGDYYLFFGTHEMGWRDGLPGVFSVDERRTKPSNTLVLRAREAIEHPSGLRAMETFWFGYLAALEGKEPRAYPFTERRQLWIIDWAAKKYAADPNRIHAGGGSMGAWGSTTFALRHPERFAVVYPDRPRTRQRGLPSLVGPLGKNQKVLLDDGKTDYFERMDMVRFAAEHAADLPFFAWCCGRRDGFASWQEQVDMAKAMAASRHGFAFAWNNGDHSSGSQPMARVMKHYSAEKFARNQSYPAFRNSSLDDNPGNGDPKDGDLEGGINLGFLWKNVVDTDAQWSVRIANDLAKNDMTVDVTPRRLQQFKLKPGDTLKWTTSTGGAGATTVDARSLATIAGVRIRPNQETTLTLTRER